MTLGLALNLESVLSMPYPSLTEESSSTQPKDSSESKLDWSNLSRELTEFQSMSCHLVICW